MHADNKVAVVIPLFNEAIVVGEVISELRQSFQIIVCVDDGSTDNSAIIAKKAGAFVIKHPLNLGQGAALQTGIQYVKEHTDAQFIATFDSDGQHSVSDLLGMLDFAESNELDIVFGSRFLDGRSNPSVLKKLVLKLAVKFTNLTTGLKLTDAHNGLRLLRRTAFSRLNLLQNRMAHGTEIVQQLGSMNLKWAEYPVRVLYTDYSKSKGQSVLNSVNILFDLLVK